MSPISPIWPSPAHREAGRFCESGLGDRPATHRIAVGPRRAFRQHGRGGDPQLWRSLYDRTLAWFAQNFSEGYLRDPILGGVLPMPGGDIAEPIIDIDDIADVVVAALTEDGHIGERYEVTGPQLMTFAEMANVLSTTLGRSIQHIPISFEDFHANVAAAGDSIRCRRFHHDRPGNA
jgi:nucleoside-diphosphate-sugar epimerase